LGVGGAPAPATRYKNFLSSFIGQAVNELRMEDQDDDAAPVMFVLDEAANIPLVGLKEIAGVGRGRKIGLMLGYQNMPQVQDQYGHDSANAILGSVGTMIFLPGLDDATAQFASRRIGQTTAWSHTTVDGKGGKFDNERQSETGRALMDPTEIRQMVKHRQCVVIIDTSPPIKAGYPPFAVQRIKAMPNNYGEPTLVSLASAEEAHLRQIAQRMLEEEVARAAAGLAAGDVDGTAGAAVVNPANTGAAAAAVAGVAGQPPGANGATAQAQPAPATIDGGTNFTDARAFMDEIRAIASDLEKFVRAKPGTVKPDLIAARLQQYKDVKAKASTFATLLNIQQTNILKELEALTQTVEAVVLGKKSPEATQPAKGKDAGTHTAAPETKVAPANNQPPPSPAAQFDMRFPPRLKPS
jgi:hypothetical protein